MANIKEVIWFVEDKTRNKVLLRPYQLINTLQRVPGLPGDEFKRLVKEQGEIALARNNYKWVKETRQNAMLFFDDKWLSEFLPTRSGQAFRRKVTPFQDYQGQGSQVSKDFRPEFRSRSPESSIPESPTDLDAGQSFPRQSVSGIPTNLETEQVFPGRPISVLPTNLETEGPFPGQLISVVPTNLETESLFPGQLTSGVPTSLETERKFPGNPTSVLPTNLETDSPFPGQPASGVPTCLETESIELRYDPDDFGEDPNIELDIPDEGSMEMDISVSKGNNSKDGDSSSSEDTQAVKRTRVSDEDTIPVTSSSSGVGSCSQQGKKETQFVVTLGQSSHSNRVETSTVNETHSQANVEGGEAAVRSSKRKRSGYSRCFLCATAFKSLRQHSMSRHIPTIFHDHETKAQLMNPDFQQERVESLKKLASLCFGAGSGIWDLYKYIDLNDTVPINSLISVESQVAMRALCQYQTWPSPNEFTLKPLNSWASLIHWRPVMACLGLLSSENLEAFQDWCKAGSWRSSLKIVKPFASTEREVVANEAGTDLKVTVCTSKTVKASVTGTFTESDENGNVLMEAFDSHFHLDRTGRKIRKMSDERLRVMGLNLLPIVLEHKQSVAPFLPVDLVGLVAVYCDPKVYPREFSADNRVRIAVGFHPRHADEFCEDYFNNLQRLLSSPMTVALGEIGLDHTEPAHTWKKQEEVFRHLLQYACVGRVLVLHLRGSLNSDTTIYSKGLELVKEYCAVRQPIHLHCFGGDRQVVRAWSSVFPNCYFGFTASVSSFMPEQLSALQSVSLDRLLIETDSPYMPPKGPSTGRPGFNTPAYIGDVAGIVASKTDIAVDVLLRATVDNGRSLYQFN